MQSSKSFFTIKCSCSHNCTFCIKTHGRCLDDDAAEELVEGVAHG